MLKVLNWKYDYDYGVENVLLENGKWYALDDRRWNGEYYRSYEVEDGLTLWSIKGTDCEIRPVYKWDEETDTGELLGYEVD